MGVKCLAQEHNTMSPVRARTQTARSGVDFLKSPRLAYSVPAGRRTFQRVAALRPIRVSSPGYTLGTELSNTGYYAQRNVTCSEIQHGVDCER